MDFHFEIGSVDANLNLACQVFGILPNDFGWPEFQKAAWLRTFKFSDSQNFEVQEGISGRIVASACSCTNHKNPCFSGLVDNFVYLSWAIRP